MTGEWTDDWSVELMETDDWGVGQMTGEWGCECRTYDILSRYVEV